MLEGYPLFTKTFATVNPDILLKKIECHRIRGIINCWFQSYQIGCSSLLKISANVAQNILSMLYGIPYGSVNHFENIGKCK